MVVVPVLVVQALVDLVVPVEEVEEMDLKQYLVDLELVDKEMLVVLVILILVPIV